MTHKAVEADEIDLTRRGHRCREWAWLVRVNQRRTPVPSRSADGGGGIDLLGGAGHGFIIL